MFRAALFRDLRGRLRALLDDRAGTAIITVALAVPAIVGVTGIAVEVGAWYYERRELQTASDAGAMSGAFERANGNKTDVTAAAIAAAGQNGAVAGPTETVVVNNPPTVGPNAGDGSAVEVIIAHRQSLLASALFTSTGVTVNARAVAQVQVTGSACVLALDPSASGAISNTGNPTVNMTGCTVASNSSSSNAIDIAGSSLWTVQSLWTVGGYSISGSGTLSYDKPPFTNAWALDNPYENLSLPPVGACNYTNPPLNGTLTINPGVYCGGMSFGSQANVTLNSGVYIIDQGDFSVDAQAHVSCNCMGGDGVTIILTSSGAASAIGSVTINGGADVDLAAPSDPSNPYVGVLFYQDPRATADRVNKFNGGADMRLTGAIYFPSQFITWAGSNDLTSPTCTQVVAKQVAFVGNAVIDDSTCAEAGVQPITITGVRLVE